MGSDLARQLAFGAQPERADLHARLPKRLGSDAHMESAIWLLAQMRSLRSVVPSDMRARGELCTREMPARGFSVAARWRRVGSPPVVSGVPVPSRAAGGELEPGLLSPRLHDFLEV